MRDMISEYWMVSLKMKNWGHWLFIVYTFVAGLNTESLQAQTLLEDVSDRNAEQLFKDGSYQRAHQRYLSLNSETLSQDEKNWREFRIIDCGWRAKANTRQRDNAWSIEANSLLKNLIEKLADSDVKGFIIASINESLGDLNQRATSIYSRNQWEGYYKKALEFWAASEPSNEARSQYLSITRKLFSINSSSRNFGRYFARTNYTASNNEILKNALSIAESKQDLGVFVIYLAHSYGNSFGNGNIEKSFKILDRSIEKIGEGIWLWRVLYTKAQLLENPGRPFRLESGQWGYRKDFVEALNIYQKILNLDKQNQTGLVKQIQTRVEYIKKAEINILLSGFYKPKNDIQFYLSSRNVESFGLKIFPINLNSRMDLDNKAINTSDLSKHFDIPSTRPVFEKTYSDNEFKEHRSKQNLLKISGGLPAGAYMVVAESQGISSKKLLYVTDALLITQTHQGGVTYLSVEAESGKPIEGAELSVVRGIRSNNRNRDWSYRRFEFKTDNDGFIKLNEGNLSDIKNSRLLVFGDTPFGPVIHYNYNSYYRSSLADRNQKYYVFTDRPAFRPGEIVKWKALSRISEAGFYTIPGNEKLEYAIINPRGQEIEKGNLKLNEFGSVSREFKIPADATLGNYALRLKPSGDKSWRSNDTLFRLEEYKLPDFKVDIVIPEEGGTKKVFKPGETIEAHIEAQYYFGAPVKDSEVEVVIKQSQWYSGWPQPRPEPWFMDSGRPSRPFRVGGKEILRKTLKTDSDGRALLKFEPQDLEPGIDYKFIIEVKVTDSSRVVVRGAGEIKVIEREYFTRGKLNHTVHKPGDLIEVEWSFRDANENPHSPKGQVLVSKQVKNPDYVEPKPFDLRKSERGIPPHPSPDEYLLEQVDLVRVDVKNGKYIFQWRPQEDGIYKIQWLGDDVPMYLDEKVNVTAWVLRDDQTTVQYRSGGIEIILDQDSVSAGEECLFVLSASKPDSYVWLAFENGNVWEQKILKINGNASIQRHRIDPKTARNIFIHAVSVRDYSVFKDQKELIVPPEHKIATLELKPMKDVVRPGGKSRWEIEVKDHSGHPLVGELALAIYDKSIDYIQKDTSKPIEKFFYGDRFSSTARFQSMLNFGQFQNLYILDHEEKHRVALGGLEKGISDRFGIANNAVNRTSARGRSAGVFFDSQPEAMMSKLEVADEASSAPDSEGGTNEVGDPLVVRKNFDKTAFWSAHILTDKDGKAEIEFNMPDSLTEWSAVGRFTDDETIVAQATSSVTVNNPLSVRLELPRYLISGDEAILTASVLNQSKTSQQVEFSWEIGSSLLEFNHSNSSSTATLKPDEEKIFLLKVTASDSGDTSIKAFVRSNSFSDGIEKNIPILPHGIDKLDFKSGKVSGDDVLAKVVLPAQRRQKDTSMIVRVTPSMAVTMLDALPYLVQYPYGCTEQTMSRFVPAVVVSKTLTDFGLNEKDVIAHIRGGIEKSYLNSTHHKSEAKIEELDKVINDSLDRIYDFQKPSGGWGWWKQGSEDIYMTAYVVWGLSLSMEAGLEIDRARLERGRSYLLSVLGALHSKTDLLAWTLRAVGDSRVALNSNEKPGSKEIAGFKILWEKHQDLNAYTRSLLALIAHNHGETAKAKLLVRNLENGIIKVDGQSRINKGIGNEIPPMHHWGNDRLFYRWSDSAVEGTSTAIEALTKINPKSPLLEPAVNWLLAQRRAASWNNTKDTAISILALAGYVKDSGELEKDLDVDVIINGEVVSNIKMDKASILKGLNSIAIPERLLDKNILNVKIRNNTPNTPFYFNIETRYYSLEDPIQPTGNSIFAKRTISKIESVKTLLKGYRDRNTLLGDLPRSMSGDRINVALNIENKVDLEYVMIEDFKPAGLEFLEMKSGGGILLTPMHQDKKGKFVRSSGRAIRTYNEWRDNRCVLFIDKLPAGVWSLSYEARVQIPGAYHGLPVKCEAMYIPEIKGNSLEQLWTVEDKH